jgi:hypothetical protein
MTFISPPPPSPAKNSLCQILSDIFAHIETLAILSGNIFMEAFRRRLVLSPQKAGTALRHIVHFLDRTVYWRCQESLPNFRTSKRPSRSAGSTAQLGPRSCFQVRELDASCGNSTSLLQNLSELIPLMNSWVAFRCESIKPFSRHRLKLTAV